MSSQSVKFKSNSRLLINLWNSKIIKSQMNFSNETPQAIVILIIVCTIICFFIVRSQTLTISRTQSKEQNVLCHVYINLSPDWIHLISASKCCYTHYLSGRYDFSRQALAYILFVWDILFQQANAVIHIICRAVPNICFIFALGPNSGPKILFIFS